MVFAEKLISSLILRFELKTVPSRLKPCNFVLHLHIVQNLERFERAHGIRIVVSDHELGSGFRSFHHLLLKFEQAHDIVLLVLEKGTAALLIRTDQILDHKDRILKHLLPIVWRDAIHPLPKVLH